VKRLTILALVLPGAAPGGPSRRSSASASGLLLVASLTLLFPAVAPYGYGPAPEACVGEAAASAAGPHARTATGLGHNDAAPRHAAGAGRRRVGETYYVSPTGSDRNPGTFARPFATVNRGVRVLRPGDTLAIRGGIYPEALRNAIPSGTSWSAPVSVVAYRGEAVTLRPPPSAARVIDLSGRFAYIAIEGITCDAGRITSKWGDGIKISYEDRAGHYAHHIRLRGVEVKNASQNGILITEEPSLGNLTRHNEILGCKVHHNGVNSSLRHGIYIESSHNTVDRCEIHDNGGYGIHVYRSSGVNGTDAGSNTISNNRVYDNGFSKGSVRKAADGWGIGLSVGDGNLAYNNLVYGNKGGGIQVDLGATRTRVYHNSVYDNRLNHGIEFGRGSRDGVCRNNISHGNKGGNYFSSAGSRTTADHNLFAADPQWVNPAGGDFRLRKTSPAIDAGAPLPEVPRDFGGTRRPQGKAYDIGAYEYRSPNGGVQRPNSSRPQGKASASPDPAMPRLKPQSSRRPKRPGNPARCRVRAREAGRRLSRCSQPYWLPSGS
jgi:parallel beta-helix repeat protein